MDVDKKSGAGSLYRSVSKKVRPEAISRFFHIDKWSRESRILFYSGLKSLAIVLLVFFHVIGGLFAIIDLMVNIIIFGFVFTRVDKKYNYTIVLAGFVGLALVSTPLLSLTLDSTGPAFDFIDPNTHTKYYITGYNNETGQITEVTSETNQSYHLYTDSEAEPERRFYIYVTKELSTLDRLANAIGIRRFAQKRVFILEAQYYDTSTYQGAVSGLFSELENLGEGLTLDKFADKMRNFMDVINWIYFLFLIGYGASSIGDAIFLRWDKIARKAAIIGLSIAFYTLIIWTFSTQQIPVRSIADTIGSAWTNLLEKVGFLSLDGTSGEVTQVHVAKVPRTLASLSPIFVTITCFILAFKFRHRDVRSVLFARKLRSEASITKPTKFRVFILIVITVYLVYLVGYTLIYIDSPYSLPGGESLLLRVVFAVTGILCLVLIGLNLIYLNDKLTLSSFARWTLFGFAGLILYFQFVQPMFWSLGLRDTPNDIIFLSQGASIIDSDCIKQFFLIAMPETLLFQVMWPGAWNRGYYEITKGKALTESEDRKNAERLDITAKIIRYYDRAGKSGTSKEKVDNLVQAALLDKRLMQITEAKKPEPVGHNYFIVPTLVSGLFGAFLFSDYHRFRRGTSFNNWWGSNEGIVFMGAGFWLTFVAFFNLWSAIFVHWLNNAMVLLLSS